MSDQPQTNATPQPQQSHDSSVGANSLCGSAAVTDGHNPQVCRACGGVAHGTANNAWIMAAVSLLRDHGIFFAMASRTGGCMSLSDDDISDVLSRGADVVEADRLGVVHADFMEYVAACGSELRAYQCEGRTVKGRQCRNMIPVPLKVTEWRDRNRYCRLHGD